MVVPTPLVARSDIESTARKVGEFVAKCQADLVLLQEVDHGARRTAYVDELVLLRSAMPTDLRSHVAAFYWE